MQPYILDAKRERARWMTLAELIPHVSATFQPSRSYSAMQSSADCGRDRVPGWSANALPVACKRHDRWFANLSELQLIYIVALSRNDARAGLGFQTRRRPLPWSEQSRCQTKRARSRPRSSNSIRREDQSRPLIRPR
jgi:hypothetical protein